MNRRTAIKSIAAAALAAPAILRGRYQLSAQSAATYSARAITLVRESPVIDMLCPFAIPQPRPQGLPLANQWLLNPSTFTEADYAKFRDSGIKVFALGLRQPTYEAQLTQWARWNGFIASHSDWFTRIDDPSDLQRIATLGKVGIMITAQDVEYFRDVRDVEVFRSLGQRVAQLTYNYQNLLGAGVLEHYDSGLTVFGHNILQQMQTVGMAVDASHCGDRTTLDALAAAKRPMLFTHASCRALVPGHVRCKTDEMIGKLAAAGGVMGIPFVKWIIRSAPPVNVEHVVDHIVYVTKLVGVEHVGIGSDIDIDGYGAAQLATGAPNRAGQPNFERMNRASFPPDERGIDGLDHPRRIFDLTDALIRRGFTDAHIRSILGDNWIRVLTAAW